MSESLTKRDRNYLRALAAQAHESELSEKLEELFDRFCKWADNGMSAFDLNDEIHDFHNGISRALYRDYVTNDPLLAAALGISRGFLDSDEISRDLMKILEPMVESLREVRGSTDDETT